MKETKAKNPCKECPFNRNNILPVEKRLGGSSSFTYVGQIEGPFWLPCHMDKNYKTKEVNTEEVNQCAGAAIFRANLGLSDKFPKELLRLNPGHPDVYTSYEEFIANTDVHLNEEMAKAILEVLSPTYHMHKEMQKNEIVYIKEIIK